MSWTVAVGVDSVLNGGFRYYSCFLFPAYCVNPEIPSFAHISKPSISMLLPLVCTDYAQYYVSITKQDLITPLIITKDGSGM